MRPLWLRYLSLDEFIVETSARLRSLTVPVSEAYIVEFAASARAQYEYAKTQPEGRIR